MAVLKYQMKNILFIFLLPVLLLSCSKDRFVDSYTGLNIPYGTDAAQKMDIYLPDQRNMASTKVIVLIHGGGWTQGDKTDFTLYVDSLKKRLPGYAIFNINYRLSTVAANFFPTQENDVKSAIEFIYSKRTEYAISDKYVLIGASAGAHLALLHAYKYNSPVSIKAVVDFFGPVDLAAMYNNPINPLVPALLQGVTGGTPVTHPVVYQQSSPINFVTAQTPPTILLHGGADVVVAPSQSVLLKNSLQSAGVVHQYVFYPTENHGWLGANLADSFEKITAFLAAHVN